MNFEYTVNRDPELEAKAKSQPYLFGPFSFKSVNKFMCGTGVVFQDEPLSRKNAYLTSLLIDSYAREFSVHVAGEPNVYYIEPLRIEYNWSPRLHFFSLFAFAEITSINYASRRVLLSAGTYDRPDLLQECSVKLNRELETIFGMNELSRTKIYIQLSSK